MELRHLENLAAVAEKLHLRRGTQRLHVAHLHAAVCAGEAPICVGLGTPVLRAPSVLQAVHPARETTASGDHQLSFLRAGLGELDVR